MRVVHVVSETIANRTNGYTLRTERVVAAQRAIGIDAGIVCGERRNIQHVGAPARLLWSLTDLSPEDVLRVAAVELLAAASMTADLACIMTADVIHAHAPWFCAWGASADTYSRRWVYEVRGLQEESAVTDGRWPRDGKRYAIWRAGEDWARQNAKAVFAISPQLAADATARGARDVELTPNAVDGALFYPRTEAERVATRARYALGSGPIVAYLGSLRPLEGVDELVRAMPALLRREPTARCLIVGGGAWQPLLALAAELGVSHAVEYRPAQPSEDIPALVGAVDCVAITRPDAPVTRSVTPLKPLEALASGVPVVSSDLPALRYVGEAGTLFYPPGEVETLAERITEAFDRRRELGEAGRAWVERERTWEGVARTYLRTYERIMQ